MKSLRFIVSILLIAIMNISCQPTDKKTSSSLPISTKTDSQTIFEMPPNLPNMDTGSLQRSLNRYWNLVSFPVETTQSVQSFLENQDYANQIQSVWSWDASLGESGAWRVFPQHPDFTILENISPDNGYWIRARNSFEFSGTGVSENLYNFSVGWNLIGVSHSQEDINITDFFVQGDFWKDSCGRGSTYDSVWAWQNNTWKVHFAETGKLEEFNNQQGTSFEELITLESGMGVWINTLRANTPPPPEGCGNSGDDHGNDSSTATVLSLDTSLSGNIEVAGDEDFFSFTVENSGYYQFESSGDTDTQVYLYDASLQEIGYNDQSGEDNNFKLLKNLEEGQIYYFKVSHWNSSATGQYQVVLTFIGDIQDDHGNDFDSATPLSFDTDTQGNIELSGDIDYFSITAETSELYIFESAGSTWMSIVLFDSNRNYLGQDFNSAGNGNFRLYQYLETGQTYFFEINGNDYYTGEYSVSVKQVIDHGNDSGTATALELSTPLEASINSTTDIDYFSFTPVSNGNFTFFTIGELDTFASLYDSNENELFQDEDSGFSTNPSITYQLEANQTYFLKILSNTQNTGQYTIFVVSETNDILQGVWFNGHAYYQIGSDNSAFYCYSSTGWSLRSLIGNLVFHNSELLGNMSVNDNILTLQYNDGYESQFSAGSELSQECSDVSTKIFSTPPNYQGYWYNNTDGTETYYEIDENNVVQDCQPQSSNAWGHSASGILNGNIIQFPYSQALLTLNNDILTLGFQYNSNTTDYQKVTTVPSPCGDFFEGN